MHLLESEDALLRQVEHHILSVLQLDCHEDGILSLGPLDAWELSTTRNIIDKLEFLGCLAATLRLAQRCAMGPRRRSVPVYARTREPHVYE